MVEYDIYQQHTPAATTHCSQLIPAHPPLRRHRHRPFSLADTRLSAAWFCVYSCVLLPWTLTYWIGGPGLLGEQTYRDLDVTSLDLAGAGFGGG